MNIFISYSTPDLKIVQELANQLRVFGAVNYWGKSRIPGEVAWETIFKWIDYSDFVIVLITGNTVKRAMSVGQELARAKSKNKKIIPIISNQISIEELGFMSGITYQTIDVNQPQIAIEQLTNVIRTYHKNLKEKQNFAIGMVVIGFLIWSSRKQ